MERVKIRTEETWRRFDFWAVIIMIALVLLLWWMWFKEMGPGSDNCCRDDSDEQADAAMLAKPDPEPEPDIAPAIVVPEPQPEPKIVATEDYRVAVSRQGRKTILTGEVADQETLDAVLAAAKQAFAGDEIVSEMTISPTVKSFDSALLGGVFASMNTVTDASLSVTPGEWVLGGSVASDAEAGQLSQRISEALPGNLPGQFRNNVEVIAPIDCKTIVSGVNIEFATGKSALTDAGKKLVLRLVDCLTGNSYEIVGHSDSVGNADFNRALSLKRATAVRDYLSEIGLDTSNVVVTGKGEDEPLVDDQGRGDPRNRRIEFRIN